MPSSADGVEIWRPDDLARGEECAVFLHPRTGLAGMPVLKWIEQAMTDDPPPTGATWNGPPKVEPRLALVAGGSRLYRTSAGQMGVAVYVAVSVDHRTIRLARWAAGPERAVMRYRASATTLLQGIPRLEEEAAVADRRAVAPEFYQR